MHTGDDLLVELKLRGVIPAQQKLVDNPSFFLVAHGVMVGRLAAMIKSVREEFFVTTSYHQFVADQQAYDIPDRAMGRAIKDILRVDYDSSDLPVESSARDLPYISVEDLHRYGTGTSTSGFSFQDDQILIVPTPADKTAGLKLKWFMRPSRPCMVAQAAQISSISSGVINVNAVPSGWSTDTVLDFVKNAQGCSTLGYDKKPTNVAAGQLTFTAADVPARLTTGDWISAKETSPVIQVPDEVFPLLVALTTQRILKLAGDDEGAKALTDEIKEEEEYARFHLTPRAENEPQQVVNRNGLLRGRSVRRNFLFRY